MKKWYSAASFVLLVILVICLLPMQAQAASIQKYYQTSKDSVPIWSDASSNSTRVATIASAGYVLYISSSTVNAAGNTWYKIGSGAYAGDWVYSGNVTPHSHSYWDTYASRNDCFHTTTHACTASGCGYSYTSVDEHAFSGGICVKCGKAAVGTTAGLYQTNSTSVYIYESYSSSSTRIATVTAQGTVFYISSVIKNSANNYWGNISNGTYSGYWVYMGNLIPHSHTYAMTYAKKNDCFHTTTHACTGIGCGYSYTSVDGHTFSGGICTQCGKAAVATTAGFYQTNSTCVYIYESYSSSSKRIATVTAQGTVFYISSVTKNSADNYWGKISGGTYSGRWVYMGNLITHTHSNTTTYAKTNDLQHTTTKICNVCGYKTVTLVNHTYNNGACTACGALKPKTKAATYLALKTITTYAKASSNSTQVGSIKGTRSAPIKVIINKVTLNTANNYWGNTSAGTWVYMGNLDYYTPAASIAMSNTSITKYSIGSYFKLTATTSPEAAYDLITWSSSNQNVATVSSDGTVTIKAFGVATITAKSYTDPKITATCKVTAKDYSSYYNSDAANIKKLFVDWSSHNGVIMQYGYGYCTTDGAIDTCADAACNKCYIGNVTAAMRDAGFISYTVTGGWSCNGFARFALRHMYGVNMYISLIDAGTLDTSNPNNKTNSALLDFLRRNDARAGDMLWIRGQSDHFMVLLSIDAQNSTVKIIDGNGDGKRGVQIRNIPFSLLYSRSVLHIKKASDASYESAASH